jgi:hypothetical protein
MKPTEKKTEVCSSADAIHEADNLRIEIVQQVLLKGIRAGSVLNCGRKIRPRWQVSDVKYTDVKTSAGGKSS